MLELAAERLNSESLVRDQTKFSACNLLRVQQVAMDCHWLRKNESCQVTVVL